METNQQGNITSVGGTKTYNLDSLTNVPQIQTPPQQPAIDLNSLVASLGNQALATQTDEKQNTSDVESLFKQLAGQTADEQAMGSTLGLDQSNKDLNELQKVANQQTAQYIAEATRAEGARNLRQETNVVQNNLARQRAVDVVLSNALISAKQGDIQYAQGLIDKAMAVKYDPIKQQLEYKKFIATQLGTKASKAQENLLNAQLKQVERQQQNEKDINSVLLEAQKSGASPSVIEAIKNSSSYSEAIKNAGPSLSTLAKLDIELKRAEIAYKNKQMSLLGEPTAEEKKAQKEALKNAKSSIPVLEDKLTLIDGILNSSAIDSTVGTTFTNRGAGTFLGATGRIASVVGIPALIGGAFDKISGEKQDLVAGVNQLVSKEFLSSVLGLKAQGGTLGQITEREGEKLQNAATKIGTWEIKDSKGRVIGYNASEKDFKDEMNKIKNSTNTILNAARGNIMDEDEQSLLDNVFSTDNTALEPSNFYK
jgi:hypothetical protein